MLVNTRPWSENGFYQKRIFFVLKKAPVDDWVNSILSTVSLPFLGLTAQRSMDDIYQYLLQIKVKDPNDTETIQALKADLEAAIGQPVTVMDRPIYVAPVDDDSNDRLENIVNMVFSVIIAIMMFLCFFSLSASMSANLLEQTKEIGVLRSMGVTKIRISLLYFYEALLVVFAASTLGILVGCIVGYSMKLQMNLLMDQESTFKFPWIQLLEIFVLSLLCAFCSTFGPASKITEKQVASILRMA